MCKKLTWFMVLTVALSMATGSAFGQSVNINFQQEGGDLVEGYLPDYGYAYGDQGNGFSYGWNTSITADARDRNQDRAPDQRYDTTMHFSKGSDHTWEIALADGEYDLLIVCGDAGYTDQTNTLDVEGVIVVDENGEMDDNYWDEYTLTVDVVDGRLSIKPAEGASNAKICFVDIVQVGPARQATAPSPAVGASDLLRDEIVLSWTAGPYGDLHNVYLGTSADDVAMADIDANNVPDSVAVVTVDTTSYDPGPLALGTTYYWRVDEVSLDPNIAIASSAIWSFTVEPGLIQIDNVVASASTAYSDVFSIERTIDGSGMDNGGHSADGRDMWLSNGVVGAPVLTYEFDGAYKLDHMMVWNSNTGIESIFGYGAKDVTIEYLDGSDWVVLADVELAQASGVAGDGGEMIDLGGIGAYGIRLTINSNHGGSDRFGLAEVSFVHIPVKAREPQPADGATGVPVDVTLSWRSGIQTEISELELSSNRAAVANNVAIAALTTGNSIGLGPLGLSIGTTYYWRINEVNISETPIFVDGDIWSFTTVPYFVVDDFESYGDLGGTWQDGWAKNSGIKDGDTGTHTIDTAVAEGGAQSMLLSYDNSKQPYIVEVERSISGRTNWEKNGVNKLVLSFLGDPGNSPRDRLYVKINGKQVYYGGDLTSPWWKSWSISLSGLGINVASISELAIGVGDTPLPAGGKGKLYIDNVRLYKEAPSTSDIVDVVLGLNGDGQFDTLIAALQVADPALLEELSSEGAYTVFAPTDDAFDAIGINAGNVGSVDEAVLNDVLLYHVAAGTLLAADLPADVAVLEGSPLMQADGVLTDDTGGQAAVTQADAMASNGVVHVIDAVLLPYNLVTVGELLAQVNAEGDLAGQFDTLLAALDVADASVAGALAGDGQVTLLAPTDDALALLGLDPNSVGDPNVVDPALVTAVLLTHVAEGRLLAADLPAEIATLEGSTLAQAGGVLTDDTGGQATVTATDIEAINGVIHAIDAVVLPFYLTDMVELLTMLNSDGEFAGQLDTLIAAASGNAAVLEVLTDMSQNTLFAPTDDAFAALDVTAETVGEVDPNLVTAVLLYHVADGRLMAADVLASAEIAMLEGGSVMQADGILTDNVGGTSAIIATDGEALNGVIHVIDAVLAPIQLVEPEPEPEPVDPTTIPQPW